MGKRVGVQLFGLQNRKVIIDSGATEGATIGRDLFLPDGTLITVNQILNQTVTGTTTPALPALWGLIIGVPQQLKDIASLVDPGYLYHDGTNIFAHEWPLHDKRVEIGETLTIPANKQYLIWQEIVANGDIVIEAGGELVILDEGLSEPTGPDFTYSVGNLSQIDYDGGEQKLFTYDGGGNLTRVDYIRDGLTLRKDFAYGGGGELDYIDEYYL